MRRQRLLSVTSLARLVLRLSPRRFRARYSQEILADLMAALAEERRRAGGGAVCRLGLRALADLVATVAREWVGFWRVGIHRPFDDLGCDLRGALRSAWRARAMAVTLTATIAFGIGLTAATFAFADGYLFRPSPFPDSDRLFVVRIPDARIDLMRASEADALRESELAHLGFVESGGSPFPFGILQIGDRSVRTSTGGLRPGFSELLGVPLALGRHFTADEHHGAEPFPIWLAYRFWQREFGGDPGVLGRMLDMQSGGRRLRVQIVGVTDARITTFNLNFGRFQSLPDLFAPAQARQPQPAGASNLLATPIVRLPGDLSPQRAETAIGVVLQRVAPSPTDTPRTVRLVPLQAELGRAGRSTALFLMLGAGLAMLLVAVNVAHLLLTHGMVRAGEMATRAALGASRWRITRLFLVESGMYGVAGTAAGLWLARWFTTLLAARLPTRGADAGTLALVTMHFDRRVVAFAIAMGLLAVLAGGVWPAWRATRRPLAARSGNRTVPRARVSARLSRGIIISEVTLSTIVLTGAVFAGMGIWRFLHQPLGFDLTDRFSVSLQATEGADETSVEWPLVRDAIRDVRGVRAASSDLEFLNEAVRVDDVSFDDGSAQTIAARVDTFAVLGVRLLTGRLPAVPEYAALSPVAVVDDRFARAAWPGRSPLGRQVRVGDRHHEVIGVVNHMRLSLVREAPGLVYVPRTPVQARSPIEVWAPGSSAEALTAGVSAAIREVAPGYRAGVRARTFENAFEDEIANARFQRPIVIALGAFAFALAGVGLFGLVAYLVEQRTRDFGIQLALGARRGDIYRSLMRQGVWPALAGLGIGLPTAWGLGRVMEASMFGWESSGAATFAITALLVAGVTLLAVLAPARRVLRIDPATTLRTD